MLDPSGLSKSERSRASKVLKFDAIIIDEAAQAVEPSTLIPFKFRPKVLRYYFIAVDSSNN
jgi:superfamily I DNA and/or RNA helicase